MGKTVKKGRISSGKDWGREGNGIRKGKEGLGKAISLLLPLISSLENVMGGDTGNCIHPWLIVQHNISGTTPIYPCAQCEFVTTTERGVKEHSKYMHEGIRPKKRKLGPGEKPSKSFLCDQCDFVTHQMYKLKEHTAHKHEGMGVKSFLIGDGGF